MKCSLIISTIILWIAIATASCKKSEKVKIERVEEVFLEADFPKDLRSTVTVSDIMDTDVVTVEEDMSMTEARMLMRVHNSSKIPVTKNNALVGFITLFDIIIALFKVMDIIE